MSNEVRSPLTPAATDRVGSVLQPVLVELLDLTTLAKQVHWTVVGPEFRSVHLQLDEVVATSRAASDQVAERLAIVGVLPDGRSSTVASKSELPSVDQAWLPTADAVSSVANAVQALAARTRTGVQELDGADPITEDILIAITTDLEEHLWMLNAQER